MLQMSGELASACAAVQVTQPSFILQGQAGWLDWLPAVKSKDMGQPTEEQQRAHPHLLPPSLQPPQHLQAEGPTLLIDPALLTLPTPVVIPHGSDPEGHAQGQSAYSTVGTVPVATASSAGSAPAASAACSCSPQAQLPASPIELQVRAGGAKG